jgi:hypothetical protein
MKREWDFAFDRSAKLRSPEESFGSAHSGSIQLRDTGQRYQ